MNLITVAKARLDPRLVTVVGKCGNTSTFLSYLNNAIGSLMAGNDWFSTLQRVEVCIDENCIAWPNFVGKVRALNICKRSMLVQGIWYSFLPFRPGMCNPRTAFQSALVVENQGLVPTFRQIRCGVTWYVRLYIERQADIGKTVTIYGIDSHGQVIRTKKADGTYSEGVVLTATKTFASTAFTVRRIDRVSLQEGFVGNSRLYGYDADADLLHDLALYEPGMTEPAYVFQKIIGGSCCIGNQSCNGFKSVEALIKLNDDPLLLETDILQIQNIEAIKQMIQAIRKEEAGEFDAYRERKNAAISEMNSTEKDWIPDNQIPVEINPWGTARPTRARIGLVI